MGFKTLQTVIDGNYIKKLRNDTGLNVYEFANMFGVSGQTVLNWESNKSYPSPLHIANMTQLRAKIDTYRNNDTTDDVQKVISSLLITGGIIAVLYWLFNKD